MPAEKKVKWDVCVACRGFGERAGKPCYLCEGKGKLWERPASSAVIEEVAGECEDCSEA